jgi:putative ubiquitin-RnfH superfamily antitoxin RatB of RatAB toxin-antitoxin module
MVSVEVVYARPTEIWIKSVLVAPGSTVLEAIHQSDFEQAFPLIKDYVFGIFSKPVTGDAVLYGGERIEIYRPLAIDPKEKRRLIAKKRGK